MGVVDQDHGTQALRIREAFDSIAANVSTFKPIYYDDDKRAQEDVRTGKLDGAVIIPPQFSSKFYEQNHPRLGLVVDNSDQFMSTSLEQKMQELTDSLNSAHGARRAYRRTSRWRLSSFIRTSNT